MQIQIPVLGLIAFLLGSRAISSERLGAVRKRVSEWFEETHCSAFELRRHFFRRFFDSELISDPAQTKVVAGGVLAVLVSLSFLYVPSYYHKYVYLQQLPEPDAYNRAALADFLFVITLIMSITALLTTLQWPSL